ISDITVGRETVEFLGLRRAILTETVLCPETYAGMKNMEAPFGTVNQTRSGLIAFPLASLRYASRASSMAFEYGRRFFTSASVMRSKSPSPILPSLVCFQEHRRLVPSLLSPACRPHRLPSCSRRPLLVGWLLSSQCRRVGFSCTRPTPTAPYYNPGLLRSAPADLPSQYSPGLSDSPATIHTLPAWLASLEGHRSCICRSGVRRLAGSRSWFQVQSPDTTADTRPRLVLG